MQKPDDYYFVVLNKKGDRIGLVGVNGCGKTTLFRAMRGEADYDGGEFVKSKDAVLGYMEQHVVRDSAVSVYDEVLSVFEDIVKTRGTTVVMITHNPEIARMANRVVKLKNGLVASIRLNLRPAKAVELVW